MSSRKNSKSPSAPSPKKNSKSPSVLTKDDLVSTGSEEPNSKDLYYNDGEDSQAETKESKGGSKAETKESKDDSEGKKSDEDKTTTEDLKSRVKSLEEVVKKKLSGSESDSLVTLLSGR